MIELSLLGSPQLRNNGTSVDAILVQPRRLALLAYLATAGGFQRRDRLLLLFWGDQTETRGRASLRQALHFVRRSLGDDAIVARGHDEVALSEGFNVDVVQLESALREQRFAEAITLYRGDFLEYFNVDDAAEFERWSSDVRRDYRRRVAEAAWKLAAAVAERGNGELAPIVRRALELNDFAEPDVQRGMKLLAQGGQFTSALEVYELFRQRLASDEALSPDARTAALAAEIRDSSLRREDAIIPAPQLPSPSPLPVVLEAQPSEAVPVSSHRTTRRPLFAVAAAVVLMTAATVALINRRGHTETALLRSANRVAVFPFVVRSSDQKMAYLREGAATLLGLSLDGAGALRTVDPGAVLSAVPGSITLTTARHIAESFGAGRFVLGEVNAAGARVNVAAVLYDVEGHEQGRATASGDEVRVFELVDSIARRLAVVSVTDSSVRLAAVAATSTASLEAFKHFLAGESALRAGRYREAVAEQQRAVSEDAGFGLAYYRMALAREWTQGEISSDSAAALAERNGDRLPDRDRKLLAARRAFVRRDGASAEALVLDVLAQYPTDADAWAQLGEVRFHLGPNAGRSPAEASVPFLNVLRYRKNDLSARVHLVRIAALRGDLKHLDEWSTPEIWQSDASEIGTLELAAMRASLLNDASARDTVLSVVRHIDNRSVESLTWRLTQYARDPAWVDRILAQRKSAGLDDIGGASLREYERGQWAIPETTLSSADVAMMVQTVLMLAMPSTPALPVHAERVHGRLASSIRVAPIGVRESLFVAARLLEARYPQLPAVDSSGIVLSGGIRGAMASLLSVSRSYKQNPQGALESMKGLNTDNYLSDYAASMQAEVLHANGQDSAAVAWLGTIGVNSLSSTLAIPMAVHRQAELEDLRHQPAAADRDWATFNRMWNQSDADLRILARRK